MLYRDKSMFHCAETCGASWISQEELWPGLSSVLIVSLVERNQAGGESQCSCSSNNHHISKRVGRSELAADGKPLQRGKIFCCTQKDVRCQTREVMNYKSVIEASADCMCGRKHKHSRNTTECPWKKHKCLHLNVWFLPFVFYYIQYVENMMKDERQMKDAEMFYLPSVKKLLFISPFSFKIINIKFFTCL